MHTLKSLLGIDEQYLEELYIRLEKYYMSYALVLQPAVFFKGFQDLITVECLKQLHWPSIGASEYELNPFIVYWHSDIKEGKQRIKDITIMHCKAALFLKENEIIRALYAKLSLLCGVYGVPHELSLRVMHHYKLETYRARPVYDSENEFGWVSRYFALLKDPEIRSIIFTFDLKSIDNKIELFFKIGCSCCGKELQMCYANVHDNKVLCPNCLAHLLLDRSAIESHVTNWFLKYLDKYDSMGDVMLSKEAISEIVYIAKLLRPIKRIRFGYMRSERIGHQILNIGQYIDRKQRGTTPDSLDIVGYDKGTTIANSFLHTLWERYVHTIPHIWYMPLGYQVSKALNNNDTHSLYEDINGAPSVQLMAGIQGFAEDSAKLFSFTEDEIKEGEFQLSKMGVPADAQFVCIHLRNSQYLKDQKWTNKNDYSYHDHRNADIENYLSAINHMIAKGYYVIRMGHPGQQEIKITSPFLIDYANNAPTPFMDVFLSVQCAFMISTASGIDGIPQVLKKHVLLTDVAELPTLGLGEKNFWLCKNFIKSESGNERSISHYELIKEGYIFTLKDLKMRSIRVVPNTSLEILAALKLFLESFENGKVLQTSIEHDTIFNLQRIFFPNLQKGHYFSPAEIQKYISDNPELLKS